MKKQGYNARLDETLGAKHPGKHKQSLKSRRHESEAMEKKRHGHKYGSDAEMEYRNNFGHHADVIKGEHVSEALEHHFRK
jgi:hypothetical protein